MGRAAGCALRFGVLSGLRSLGAHLAGSLLEGMEGFLNIQLQVIRSFAHERELTQYKALDGVHAGDGHRNTQDSQNKAAEIVAKAAGINHQADDCGEQAHGQKAGAANSQTDQQAVRGPLVPLEGNQRADNGHSCQHDGGQRVQTHDPDGTEHTCPADLENSAQRAKQIPHGQAAAHCHADGGEYRQDHGAAGGRSCLPRVGGALLLCRAAGITEGGSRREIRAAFPTFHF